MDDGVRTIMQFVPIILIIVVTYIPAKKIVDRTGISNWNLLLCIWPGVGPMILCYIVAYSTWDSRKIAPLTRSRIEPLLP